MSRCFPFPPPGFNGKTAIKEALIQSIKLQKDSEKAITERRKEKKREKKEKRRQTKENKETSILTSTGIAHEEYAHKGEKSWTELKGRDTNKRKQEDADQLERSGITEEHGQPLSLQNPSNSSDSTQNSNKRRKQTSPMDVNDSCGHGNIIRIQMPLQKHKESAISASKEQLSSPSGMKGQHKESDVSASKEQICSTSGSKDLLGHCGHEVGRRTSQDGICSSVGNTNVDQGLSFGPGKEVSCSTSGRNESLVLDDNRITSGFRSGITSRENKMQKIDLYTKTLIHNLVPLALPSELSNIVDDDEWLFGKTHSDGVEERRFKASGDVSCCGSSSAVWPNTQNLAEAEIYALPYAVPF